MKMAILKKSFNTLDDHIVNFEFWGTNVIIYATFYINKNIKHPKKVSFLKDSAIKMKNTLVFCSGSFFCDLKYTHILPKPINSSYNRENI
jgi:hypothetical protein